MSVRMVNLEALVRALSERGWWVTAGEKTQRTVIVGFNFLPHGRPGWLKAFELPQDQADPPHFEALIEAWKASVRRSLEAGKASDVVRLMVAEHGPDAVREAMRGRLSV